MEFIYDFDGNLKGIIMSNKIIDDKKSMIKILNLTINKLEKKLQRNETEKIKNLINYYKTKLKELE